MKPGLLILFLCLAVALAACGGGAGEATPPASALTPSPATWGPRLVYLWPADGAADLYALDPLSGGVQRLTEGAGVLEYSISSDGTSIYFSASPTKGSSHLYRLELAEGSDPAAPQLVLRCQDECRNPSLSPDGRWLAYERLNATPRAGVQVWLLNPATAQARLAGDAGRRSQNPQWSSTGLLAFYDLDGKAFILYNPENLQSIRHANQTGEPGCWLADGSAYIAPEIYYVKLDESVQVGSSHLLSYPVQGGRATDLSQADDLEDTDAACSPDGQWLAFTRKYLDPNRWSPGRQVWLMSSDGGEARMLTDEPTYNHYNLAWSPDGRWLAYLRFNQVTLNEPNELWMMNADGSVPLQLVIGGYAPQWLP
ncbi:MAG TPA: DPP IV N-terminal domain-containing protein [Anaerolineales bacterium]|nr:DPP IV N-terminal domain-containing protein [Anaerolineales bacterium]